MSARRFIHFAFAFAAAALNAPSSAEDPGALIPSASDNCESDGLRIHYEIYGEGPPLILVHGWGSDIKGNWVDTGWVAALMEVRQVVALDVRGHGQSDKPHEQARYSYAAMSDDVLAVLDRLDIPKAGFMGYSMGAFMGAYLLGHHTDRFTAMVLGGICDESDVSIAQCDVIAQALRAKDASEIENPLGKLYRTFVTRNPNNDMEALALSALQMWPEGFPLKLGGDGLKDVSIPVLIVNGAEDHPYVDTAAALADAIPGARHVRIPNTNHLTVVPYSRFKDTVLDFLRSE